MVCCITGNMVHCDHIEQESLLVEAPFRGRLAESAGAELGDPGLPREFSEEKW